MNNQHQHLNMLWLGRLQTELGVHASNAMLFEIQRDQLLQKDAENVALIDALKKRLQTAESDNATLRDQVRAKKVVKNAKNGS